MASVAFIVNPAAKSRRSLKTFNRLKPEIDRLFPDSSIYICPDHIRLDEFADTIIPSYEYIIACGGDGTVNCIASRILHSDKVLGVIPIGSGNDIAFSLGVPDEPHKALKIIHERHVSTLDAIKFNDFLCFNTIGIGIDGYINRIANTKLWYFKKWRYTASAIISLLFYNKFSIDIKIAGENRYKTHMTWMLCIANAKREGGRYVVSPNSDNTDGTFEIVLIKPVSRIRVIQQFVLLLCNRSFDKKYIINLSSDYTNILCYSNLDIHIDGEIVNIKDNYIDVRMIHSAIKVFIPINRDS